MRLLQLPPPWERDIFTGSEGEELLSRVCETQLSWRVSGCFFLVSKLERLQRSMNASR